MRKICLIYPTNLKKMTKILRILTKMTGNHGEKLTEVDVGIQDSSF